MKLNLVKNVQGSDGGGTTSPIPKKTNTFIKNKLKNFGDIVSLLSLNCPLSCIALYIYPSKFDSFLLKRNILCQTF